MAIGVVVMLIYSLAQGVYDFISGLWIHTLLPFFHGPVWAIIAIGIATFFGYALYLSEVEPEKEAADDHGMQSAGDDSANVAQGALPQVPPQQVPMVNPLTPPPQNGQPQAGTVRRKRIRESGQLPS